MRAYYNVLDKLKSILSANSDVNTVTEGNIDEVSLRKKTIYSLAHIIINSAVPIRNAMRFNVSVIVMDVVDITKSEVTDLFKGNDNEQDVFNTTLAVATELVEELRRGDAAEDGYQLSSVTSFEPFKERFEDNLAGWVATFEVDVSHDMKLC